MPKLLLSLVAALLLAGCGPVEVREQRALDGETIQVVATIGMIGDAVERVGGERVEVDGADGPGRRPAPLQGERGRRAPARARGRRSSTAGSTSRRRWRTSSSRSPTSAPPRPSRTRSREGRLLTPAAVPGPVRPARLVRRRALELRRRADARRGSRRSIPAAPRLYRANADGLPGRARRRSTRYVARAGAAHPRRSSACSSPRTTPSATSAGLRVRGARAAGDLAPPPRRAPATCRRWPTSSPSARSRPIFVESSVSPRTIEAVQEAVRRRGYDVADRRRALLRRDGRPGHAGGHLHRHGAAQRRHASSRALARIGSDRSSDCTGDRGRPT